MRVVLFGPPGAGKGTQASGLAKHLGVPHIATGDMLRKARTSGSPLGDKAAGFMDRGELVPDDLVNDLMDERLRREDAASGFVLDGYPRNADQAASLDSLLGQTGAKLDRVVKFAITKEEILRRLEGRRVCPVCQTPYHMVTRPPKVDEICDRDGAGLVPREDDADESVITRLEEYGRQTKPLYDQYSEQGLLVEIDAIAAPDEVFRRLLEALDA